MCKGGERAEERGDRDRQRIYVRDQIQGLMRFGEPSVTEMCSVCLVGSIFNGDLHCSVILNRTNSLCRPELPQNSWSVILPTSACQVLDCRSELSHSTSVIYSSSHMVTKWTLLYFPIILRKNTMPPGYNLYLCNFWWRLLTLNFQLVAVLWVEKALSEFYHNILL